MTEPRDEIVARAHAVVALVRRLQLSSDLTATDYRLLDGFCDTVEEYQRKGRVNLVVRPLPQVRSVAQARRAQ
jgi:hypothetical protein